MACEFLVAATTHRKATKGQIIAVKPEGHIWGKRETAPDYVIVRTNLSLDVGETYLQRKKRNTPQGPENNGERYRLNTADIDTALAMGGGKMDARLLTKPALDAKIEDRQGR